jgi:hypothetical protein
MSQNEFSHDPSEEKKVRKVREREKSAEELSTEHWRAVLQSESGRHVLWSILVESQFNGICGSNAPGDLTELNAKRKVGRFVLLEIEKVDADIYLEMIKENREKNGTAS